ncbi:helix-turn-helix domain-containing protein [Streptomyces antarcticus]|uniref:helix-turn-helix domain-containing protein n=1 Tax=Streptomyces antarcticus TaxID=2996458 RepID=UPI00226EB452|nr:MULTISPECIES: helix-turn-helix transcriptional regulator [unclassified Streptomyces]MCY0946415.1 helix-turn-helix transcriptional regulator [Streptomyces sp. H34-AA3]MCY0948984.1 helix-turn-helix transcriptional regulator [Streptomyces sp. H27-S2]MCZ4086581.1 helix-turn-helix transcriptional regulator [Streptomyces sp. H34-S5]
MVNIRDLDPSASPLDYYGFELRRLREDAKLKQGQLGEIIYCTGSLIGQIETARKVPTRDFSERLDAALGTGGLFSRLAGLVLRSQLPTWFQPYAEMEARATFISTFQCQLIYGLLQTEAYARAVLGVENPDTLDAAVAARMDRQRILARENGPVVWVVLDEASLHREIGGREVMRNQLAHLLSLRDWQWLEIQVLPFDTGQHAGMMGSFNLLRFDNDPDVHYSESYDCGHMTANLQVIRERSVGYARLQAEALSPRASAELIARVMEERYGKQPDGRVVA